VRLKKTATETFNLLREAYGGNTLRKGNMFEWHKRFSEGREEAEVDERSGRPVTMKTDENAEKMWTLVRTDLPVGFRMTAKEMNMDKGTVRRNLTTNCTR
jgi:hypothetical protein